ncbi:TRAP transporter small permease [Albibacillus kandeliae]|uniref:TRAP transporter small permease n=1 Tax=Albibacillus kandeliae TaxID=2174228 RepID=UPI000D6962F5|nr:TRAP transporter small permease [Albibacillus kandeliae]
MDRLQETAWARMLAQATLALTWVGAICLLGMVLLIFVGVLMRYAINTPILGLNEIVQLAAVALVMTALPYCTARGEHVGVDVFDRALGRWGRFVGDVISRVLSGGVLSVLCQRAGAKALDALEWGDATNMLGLPLWPFYAILAAGAGLCVLVFAVELVLILIGKGAE